MNKYVVKRNEDGSEITVSDIHKVLLEILVEFDRICQNHQIEYVLAYGSMLGAVRHQGFIPWDDDLDILMTRSSYFKLLSVLEQELSDDFYYQCYEKDSRYNVLLPAMKIKRKNTRIIEKTPLIKNRLEGDGLFIDIFIFDSIAENKLVHGLHRFLSTLLMPPMILLDNIGIEPKLLKKALYNYSNWYAARYEGSRYANLSLTWTFDGLRDQRVLKKDMFPVKYVKFEDGMYPVAHNTDAVLKVHYGQNYMEKPDSSQQVPKHIDDIELHLK